MSKVWNLVAEKAWKAQFLAKTTMRWLALQARNSRTLPAQGPVHILFCMVDHYEPGHGGVAADVETARVGRLLQEFPRIADRHRDSAGRPLQRTWFVPPHYHRNWTLKRLVSLCERGYGEIELHLHHGKSRPDTAANLENTIRKCIEEYHQFGIFGCDENQLRYGFIHGDWALCNSRHNRYCGVNDELATLLKTGCYADFTFPSMNEANPAMINQLYYARSCAARAATHRRGVPVRHGASGDGLMLIQGPLHPMQTKPGPFGTRIVGDGIDGVTPTSKRRVDLWVQTGIHVRGWPNWIAIKTHTHGVPDAAAVLGQEMECICRWLNEAYNDGERFVLHYVTARELYNVARAAESAATGDNPRDFFDKPILRPQYDSSPDIEKASDELLQLVSLTYPM